MELKEYKCWCHVCGAHYIARAEFMSGPTHVSNAGIDYLVRACHEHTGDQKREAFAHYQKTGRPFSEAMQHRKSAIRLSMGQM